MNTRLILILVCVYCILTGITNTLRWAADVSTSQHNRMDIASEVVWRMVVGFSSFAIIGVSAHQPLPTAGSEVFLVASLCASAVQSESGSIYGVRVPRLTPLVCSAFDQDFETSIPRCVVGLSKLHLRYLYQLDKHSSEPLVPND